MTWKFMAMRVPACNSIGQAGRQLGMRGQNQLLLTKLLLLLPCIQCQLMLMQQPN